MSAESPVASNTDLWERILRYAHSVKRPVTICVAYNADAAAACNILCSLLKNNLVLYNVQPILFLQELQDSVKKLEDDDNEEECFLFIGLGACTPLRPLFNPAKHIVIVLDNHRPVHLDNLREERVLVGEEGRELPWLLLWQSADIHLEVDRFFTNAARKQMKKRRRKRQRQRQETDRRRRIEQVESDEPSRRHRRAKKTKSEKPSKKKRTAKDSSELVDVDAVEEEGEDEDDASVVTVSSSDADSDSVDEEMDEDIDDDIDNDDADEGDESFDGSDDSDDMDDDDDEPPSASQAVEWSATDSDEALPPGTVALYYSAHCCGQSVAVELLELAVSLSRSRDAFLWYAAIGISDLFLRCAIDYASYLLALTRVRDQVVLQANARQRTSAAADGFRAKLQLAEEPQLFLLRHWSLWEAIWHAKWPAGLLRLHHMDSGEEHLRELLARSGISIRVAQQSWTESSAQVRTKAVELVSIELARLEALTPKDAADFTADGVNGFMDDDRMSDTNMAFTTGAGGVGRRPQHVIPSVKHPNIVPTITRSSGFGSGVSAMDACHLFRGVLCSPMAPLTPSASGTPDVSPDELRGMLIAHQRSLFWKATKAFDLDPNDPQFGEAVDAAKQLQSSVIVATSALMQRGVILSTRGLHYTLLNDPSRRAGTMDSFWTPLRLEYLAEHVAVALTVERGRRWAMRPLALCCAWPVRDGAHELLQIALAHSGAVNGPNRTLPAIEAWRRVVKEVEDDAANVQSEPLLPLSLRVRGRDAASHVLESLYLRSAEGTRRELR